MYRNFIDMKIKKITNHKEIFWSLDQHFVQSLIDERNTKQVRLETGRETVYSRFSGMKKELSEGDK